MAEVHDCFTPTELVLYEDLGFSPRGTAWQDVMSGFFDLDGDVLRVERAMNLLQTQWQVWQKTYTPTKQVEAEASPTGNVTTHAYDGLDREVVVTDAAGRKVRTEYFKDGKTKRITRAYQSPLMPAIAYATTSGGLARKLAFRFGWMRASKLRLPDSTAAATRSFFVIASLIAGVRSPALPMQVVQPYAATAKPSCSR